jgi:hypothetical protein
MDYYSFLYNQLWSQGYDADSLAPYIYQILTDKIQLINKTSTQEIKEDTVINTLNEIFDGSAPDYIHENHQLSKTLIYYFKNPNQIPVGDFHYGNHSELNAESKTEHSFSNIVSQNDAYFSNFLSDPNVVRHSLSGVIEPLDNNLDDVTIDAFRCIDLSVNAASFEPSSSSYTSSQSYLSSKSDPQLSPESQAAATTAAMVKPVDETATDTEDFSCFETDLSFSLGYLESVLYYKLSELPMTVVNTFSDDAMELALFLSNLDVFAAADIIIYNANAIASSKPCLHARNGGKCFRRDCIFDHDFSELTCKFWFSSIEGCQLHDCPFLHGLKVPEEHQPEMSSSNSSAQLELTDDLFPALSTTHKLTSRRSSSSLESESSSTPSNKTSASKVKEVDPRSLLSFTYKKSPIAMSAADSSSGLSSSKKMSSKNVKPIAKSTSIVMAASLKEGLSLRQHYDELTTAASSNRSNKVQQNAWVESGKQLNDSACQLQAIITMIRLGAAVSHMYQESREEARKLAIMRNRLLEEATRAYVA